ncbi:MAG: response regulator, partial [Paenibacillaceae bacterium]|nr:response regulator [Paenibacillaceae bacterium]
MSKRILIVDDDEKIAKLIEIYLTNEGYDVLKAEDGLRALEITEQDEVDLVI